MWHTPQGDRALEGPERALFVTLASWLVDHLFIVYRGEGSDPEKGLPVSTCVTQFDGLSAFGMISLLHDVIPRLLDPMFPADLEFLDFHESAIFAIYLNGLTLVDGSDADLQAEVLAELTAALRYTLVKFAGDDAEEILEDLAADLNEARRTGDEAKFFEKGVELLVNFILWDRDFFYIPSAIGDEVDESLFRSTLSIEQMERTLKSYLNTPKTVPKR